MARPRTAVPIRYYDYTGFKSHLADFQAAVTGASLDTEVHSLDRGETYRFRVRHPPPEGAASVPAEGHRFPHGPAGGTAR